MWNTAIFSVASPAPRTTSSRPRDMPGNAWLLNADPEPDSTPMAKRCRVAVCDDAAVPTAASAVLRPSATAWVPTADADACAATGRVRVVTMLARVEMGQEPPPPEPFLMAPQSALQYSDPAGQAQYAGGDVLEAERPRMALGGTEAMVLDPADPSTWRNTPRNAACPCGSGKKFKHCHGRMA